MRTMLLLSVAVMFTSIITAQNYAFNVLAQYKISGKNYKNERTTYANSKDDSYFLSITSVNNKKKGIICDLKKLMLHTFSVQQTNVNGEPFFNFSYVDSTPLLRPNSFENYQFTVSDLVTIDSTSKRVTLNAYEGSKRKKAKTSYVLEMKKNTENLFPLYWFSCFHPFTLLYKSNFTGNYLVEKAKGNTLSLKSFQHQIVVFKRVEFNLVVPPITITN